MQAVNRFFSWWSGTYRKQGCLGKVIFVGASLFILLCLCNVPIRILSPRTSAPITNNVVPTSLPTQIEKPTEILPVTSEPVITEALQQSTSTPNNVCVYCNLKCPASQGEFDFCLADPKLAVDKTLFEATLKTYCDFKGGDFCKVLVWTDIQYVPSSLPMTDEQVNNEVADYNRNKNTGNDCFKLLSAGNVVYQSTGCK